MDSLLLSLLILGVVAIGAVVVVNVLQAAGRRRRMESAVAQSAEISGKPSQQRVARESAGPGGHIGSTASGAPGGPAGERGVGAAAGAGPLGARQRREPRLGDVVVQRSDPQADADALARFGSAGQSPVTTGSVATAQPLDELPVAVPAQGVPVSIRASAAPAAADGQGSVDSVGAQTEAVPVAPAGAAQPAAQSSLSPVFDCIVTLEMEAPVPGERLLAMTQGIRRAGAKPVIIEGILAGPVATQPESAEERSEPLRPNTSYRAVRLGVLLANRNGPLNAMEYSEFVAAVQSVADQLATLADTPDMVDAIARARDLDATCAQLDAQIGLNVDAPEPLAQTQIAALAAHAGLTDRGGHRYASLGPRGEVVFTMGPADPPNRIGFLLDVPRIDPAHDAWTSMLACAQQFSAALGGRVVDDGGRPIPSEALTTIARQLSQRYESLEAIGVPAGSPLALRVFN